MGRLVRRYIRVFDLTVRNSITLGTDAAPITQFSASQIAVQGVINATALGGSVKGANFGVIASVTLTGDLVGVKARAVINTAIDVTGTLTGISIETNVLGTGTVSGIMAGLLIEQYAPATATITSTMFGIFISNYMQVSPTSYSMIRCSENGGATLTTLLQFTLGGGASPSDATWFLQVTGVAKTCWATAGDKTGGGGAGAGWLRCQIHGSEKYIQLYT